MIKKIQLLTLGLFFFSSTVLSEEVEVGSTVAEPMASETAAEETVIKQSANENAGAGAAEDELLKLEAVGESSNEAVSTKASIEKAAEYAASANPWQPAAKKFDWVQLTSGEWLKGEIKSMYNDSLDFDISLIWDRISQPATDENRLTPTPDDYRLTLGVTYTY